MMRDKERIEMYYKFGLLDWKNEQQIHKTRNRNSFQVNSINPWKKFVNSLARIIRLTDLLKSRN